MAVSRFAVCRADNAGAVHLICRLPSDAGKDALLNKPEEFRLHQERQITDFVEEQYPAGGPLDIPVMAPLGTGEGAPLVTEQLALDQFIGDRRAIDGDKRLIGARRNLVNELRRDLLANTTLASENRELSIFSRVSTAIRLGASFPTRRVSLPPWPKLDQLSNALTRSDTSYGLMM